MGAKANISPRATVGGVLSLMEVLQRAQAPRSIGKSGKMPARDRPAINNQDRLALIVMTD